MICTLIRRPGSFRITICTLNQANLIFKIEFLAINTSMFKMCGPNLQRKLRSSAIWGPIRGPIRDWGHYSGLICVTINTIRVFGPYSGAIFTIINSQSFTSFYFIFKLYKPSAWVLASPIKKHNSLQHKSGQINKERHYQEQIGTIKNKCDNQSRGWSLIRSPSRIFTQKTKSIINW